jgi:hypothetical protein
LGAGAALSLMALKFIAAFGFMGLPIFVSIATCNEVRISQYNLEWMKL